MDFTSLCDLESWCSHSSKAQDRLIEGLQSIPGNEFTHQLTTEIAAGSGLRVPMFVHRTTGLEFNLIIGGVFHMGLSQGEEENARHIDNTARIEFAQMRPVHQVRVSPFLMTKFPVLDSFARNHISIDPELLRPEFEGDDDAIPIYLSRSEVRNLTEVTGFSLPSGAQWEYACRGTTGTLFYFGNSLPDEVTLE